MVHGGLRYVKKYHLVCICGADITALSNKIYRADDSPRKSYLPIIRI